MRRPTRREAAVLAVAGATLVAGSLLLLRSCGPEDRSNGPGGHRADAPSAITINGGTDDLIEPGVMAPLDLVLDNPNEYDLLVSRITVTVTDVSAPQANTDHPCTAADFDVRHLSDQVDVTLRANRVEDLSGMGVARGDWPAVGMVSRSVNQDGCKGALLTLAYEARGVEVPR